MITIVSTQGVIVRDKYWVGQKDHSDFFPVMLQKNPNEHFGEPNKML